MDSEYLQSIRYKLQRRHRRLNNAGLSDFHICLCQAWAFLEGNELLLGVLADLSARHPNAEQEAEETVQMGSGAHYGDSESEHNSISYWVVRKCVASADDHIEMMIATSLCRGGDASDRLDKFRDFYLDPLFDCLDEALDDRRSVLFLLKKYKQRSEWFRKGELARLYADNSKFGEDLLSRTLYEYLHDQGLDFSIEERSGSGRPDLVTAQTGSDRLIADAKIFDPAKGKDLSYLRNGFNQVYQYTNDYNETFGYLVIFKACEEGLAIAADRQEGSIPLVTHNHKTIFFVVIDIFEHQKTASKRGKLKTYTLTEASIIEHLPESED